MMFCFLFQKNRHFSLAVTLLRFYYLNCKGGDNRSAVIFDYSGAKFDTYLAVPTKKPLEDIHLPL